MGTLEFEVVKKTSNRNLEFSISFSNSLFVREINPLWGLFVPRKRGSIKGLEEGEGQREDLVR